MTVTRIRLASMICVCMMLMTSAGVAQPTAAPSKPDTYNCQQMYTTEAKKTFTLPAAQIEYCIMRGWDPPGQMGSTAKFNWQPAGGLPVRTGNASSLQLGARLSPSTPPNSSSSSTTTGSGANIIHFGIAPTQSSSQCIQFQGQQVCPRCEVVNGKNVCQIPILDPVTGTITYQSNTGQIEDTAEPPTNPVAGDLGGQMGPITRISLLTAAPYNGRTRLVCGGTMNLTAFETSTVLNTTHLAILKELDRNVNIYEKRGHSFDFLRTLRLGEEVCGVKKDNKTRPYNQFIFFNPTQPKLAIRVVQPTKTAKEDDDNTGTAAAEEKYVTVRPADFINGRNDEPDCEKFEDYPKEIPDLRIISQQTSSDITAELPLSVEPCIDRTLHLDLTTPNLVHQPGTLVDMFKIAGREEAASLSTDVSILYYQPNTYLRLGVTGAPFTFRSNIVMELPGNRRLHMYGPTTITGGMTTLAINLAGGGHIEDIEGDIIQRIAPTQNYVPVGVAPPYYVTSSEKLYLPQNLMLLNERDGILRQPSNPPPPADPTQPVGP